MKKWKFSKRAILVENLVEISGRSQLYDLEESSPNALKSDETTNKNGKVNIMCLILLRFCDIMMIDCQVKCNTIREKIDF